jgi:hypothetical protein
MRMPSELMGPKFILQYQIIDIRDVAEEFLLSSPFDTDRILFDAKTLEALFPR